MLLKAAGFAFGLCLGLVLGAESKPKSKEVRSGCDGGWTCVLRGEIWGELFWAGIWLGTNVFDTFLRLFLGDIWLVMLF
jgi:hypothetical protein